MEKQEIENGNKVIALYRGYTINEDGNICKDNIPLFGVKDLKYHCDWDMLMEVVEDIATDYDVRITWMPTAINVTYIDRPDISDGEITSMGGMSAIENTFLSVVRFIEWHNKNHKTK